MIKLPKTPRQDPLRISFSNSKIFCSTPTKASTVDLHKNSSQRKSKITSPAQIF